MSYKLNKPYTNAERADFIIKYNYNQGLLIEETDNALYAIDADEMIENNTVIKNPNYDLEQIQLLKQQEKEKIQIQLDELDKKRIRAICEPSMKNENISWLEFYNQQISDLRQVMAKL